VKQWTIDKKKEKLFFGPDETTLPIISWEDIEKRVKEGEQLVVIDGIVHNIKGFVSNHPGLSFEM
jgi:stearoyl-CoA desaturase (delta-9 desaturase)